MAGHRSIDVLRERMGPKRAAKAKAQAKEIQAEMLLVKLRRKEGVTERVAGLRGLLLRGGRTQKTD